MALPLLGSKQGKIQGELYDVDTFGFKAVGNAVLFSQE